MHQRDDFTEATKRIIAQRSGYRCSNPTCRRGTVMAHPVDKSQSISQGIASHIQAASPGGPRFNADMTPEQRKSPDNGIWLCQLCARVIDTAPSAFPVEALAAWKKFAETAAVRDAQSTNNSIEELITQIETVCHAIVDFEMEWRESDPTFDYHNGPESIEQLLKHGWQRRADYNKRISPHIKNIINHCKIIFGSDNDTIAEIERAYFGADVNMVSSFIFAEKMQDLKSILQLR